MAFLVVLLLMLARLQNWVSGRLVLLPLSLNKNRQTIKIGFNLSFSFLPNYTRSLFFVQNLFQRGMLNETQTYNKSPLTVSHLVNLVIGISLSPDGSFNINMITISHIWALKQQFKKHLHFYLLKALQYLQKLNFLPFLTCRKCKCRLIRWRLSCFRFLHHRHRMKPTKTFYSNEEKEIIQSDTVCIKDLYMLNLIWWFEPIIFLDTF